MNKRYQFAALALVASLLLNACRMGKDYQRPEMKLPDMYRDQDQAADSAGMAAIRWNDFFRDSLLQKPRREVRDADMAAEGAPGCGGGAGRRSPGRRTP